MVPRISLRHVRDGDLFGHRLVRLAGHLGADRGGDLIAAHRHPGTARTSHQPWPVREGHFKAFVLLDPGENVVHLSGPDVEPLSIRLRLDPDLAEIEHRIRLCYLVARDDDGRYACSTHDGTPEQAVRRIRFLGHMMQCFTAEKLAEAGHGPLTFSFVAGREDPPSPAVDVHVSRLTRREIHALGRNWSDRGQAGWSHFAAELSDHPRRSRTIDVAVMAMTERCPPGYGPRPETGFLAHTALGGGPLALFGGASLGTWAAGLPDLTRCFTDERRCAAHPEIHDDSNGRGSFWACYSTTAGAVLHELGHCLGLPHADAGIMARGFDDFNRFFTVAEPGSAGAVSPEEERGAFWDQDSADRLRRSPYLRESRVRPDDGR
jgi:hypothetical protein